jgi:hypothetical protein
MVTLPNDRLAAALADCYRVERERGAGGGIGARALSVHVNPLTGLFTSGRIP